MALREFSDENGTAWLAWDVPPPRFFEPVRSGEDRRSGSDNGHSPERRAGEERRRRSLMGGMERGWVCFQSGIEKRRLSPPPDGWDTCPEEQLRELWKQSAPFAPYRPHRS